MMKVIEIRNTRQGEVAYIFDEEAGKLIKVLVEDYTGYNVEREEELPPRRPAPRRVVVRPMQEVDYGGEEEVEETPPPPRPRVAPKSIVPPHLAGVFKKPGTPGAAVEERQI